MSIPFHPIQWAIAGWNLPEMDKLEASVAAIWPRILVCVWLAPGCGFAAGEEGLCFLRALNFLKSKKLSSFPLMGISYALILTKEFEFEDFILVFSKIIYLKLEFL